MDARRGGVGGTPGGLVSSMSKISQVCKQTLKIL
jgi:hypothetical protein